MNHSNHHSDKDDLEQRLHSELRDYAPEAPDRLWQGIEARLPKRRRPVIVLWWLLIGVAMGLSVGGSVYHFVEGKPLAVQQSAQEIAKSVERQAIQSETRMPLNATESGEKKETKSNAFSNRANKASGFVKSIPLSLAVLSEKIPYQNQTSLLVEDNPPARLSEKSRSKVVELLPQATFNVEHNRPVSLPFLKIITQPYRKHRWQFGAVAGPVWLWQPATPANHHTNSLAFAEHSEGPTTGWQVGLSAGIALTPGWQINLGLWQRSTSEVSSHLATMRLMDGVCLNPGDPGPKEYEFQYTLNSSGNETAVTVHIAQVDSISKMPTDEPFALHMQTTRRNTDWVLPLAIQRRFGQGRWQGFVQGGGQLLLPVKRDVQVDHFTEACVDLCFATGRIPALTVKERRQASIAWMLGFGAEYRLWKRWTLSTAPTLFGNKGRTGLSIQTGLSLKL